MCCAQNAIIELKQITKKYAVASQTQVVLDDISYCLPAGVKVAVLGSSGCGKTTLLNLIGGIDADFSGALLFKGQAISDFDQYRRQHVSFIFQDLNLIAHHSLIKNITIGLTNDVADKEQKALDLLERVGLAAHAHKKPHQLSGGERQRVAVARALARDTDILLCDEPTGSLDDQTKSEIMQLIVDVFRDKTVIFITHDRALAQRYADLILQLKDKQLCELQPYSEACAAADSAAVKGAPADRTFNKRFDINLLSKKLSLFNAAYLIMVISAIFLFGTGLVRGIELKIDDYLYDKYRVDKIDLATTDYTLNGFAVLSEDFNALNDDQIVGYMTGAWLKTTFSATGAQQYNFANTLQAAVLPKFADDIVCGRLPQANDEILYSKGAAQKKVYQFHSADSQSEDQHKALFEWLIALSDEQLLDALNDIEISYRNSRQYNADRAYDSALKVVGLIDDIKYATRDIPQGGNSAALRKYNINSNSALEIAYKGQVEQLVVNDNIYMLEDEFLNFIDAVYIGHNGLTFRAFSVFIDEQNLDLRKRVGAALILYKHMVSGRDSISDERAGYYEEVHGYKLAIIAGCAFLYFFAVIAIYNGIKTRIDRNKVNIGIYKSLGYTSKNIKLMFLKEGILLASFIVVSSFIAWFVLTQLLGDYVINAMTLSEVIDFGHIVHLSPAAAVAVILSVVLIIVVAISRELRKVNIVRLIKNK